MKKIISVVVSSALLMTGALGLTAAHAEEVTELPREETLYFGGQQWDTVNSYNPIGTNQNNAMGVTAQLLGSRTIMFETLYMYNFLDGSLIPLLADGDYEWNDDLTEMTVKLKDAAKWCDGTDVTSADVIRTFEIGVEVGNNVGTGYGPYIDSIEAIDDKTFVIKAALTEDGTPVNPLKVNDFLGGVFIAQEAWIDTCVERNDGDATAILNDPADDVIWCGPYTKFFDDDQKVVFVRDDNYWGQDESMWGKLPVPKYIAHTIYADNAATEVAFKAGEIDVDQQFLPNIQDTWLKEGLPISTYMEEPPYGVCLTMPTAWYNMNNPVIAENTALRKAIAIAVDYDTIIANAMTNQSPSFADVPRSVMNPTEGEQAMYDHEAVADLQWEGNDIEGAKMAAMEVVAAAGKNIGIEITTLFPEWDIVQTVFTNPNQEEYDIFMWSPDGAGPSMPWGRVRQFLDGDLAGIENNWTGNFGQYVNDRATEIVNLIPLTSDPEELKALYTEAIEIYLTEVPSFSLMYRPAVFHEVNESVWTNFPEDGDGRNIPPADCTDGYGIAALYDLELVE